MRIASKSNTQNRSAQVRQALNNVIAKQVAKKEESIKQTADEWRNRALENAKLKADFTINASYSIPKGRILPQIITTVRDGNNRKLAELPPEITRNIAMKAADDFIGMFVDLKA